MCVVMSMHSLMQVFPKPTVVAIDYHTGDIVGVLDLKNMMKRKNGAYYF